MMTTSRAPKEEVWKPEDIITSEDVMKENIVPYGNTQDQLVPGLHFPSSSSNKTKNGTFNITATGSLSITGVGFKPSSLRIVATKNGVAYPLYSDGTSDGTNTVTYRQGRNSGGFIQYIVTDNIVSVSDYSGGWLETFSSLVSFDTNGFTLNTSSVSGTVNCSYIALG